MRKALVFERGVAVRDKGRTKCGISLGASKFVHGVWWLPVLWKPRNVPSWIRESDVEISIEAREGGTK